MCHCPSFDFHRTHSGSLKIHLHLNRICVQFLSNVTHILARQNRTLSQSICRWPQEIRPFATQILILIMGSVVIPHLVTGWHVDQAILSEDARLVVIRFGRDHDPDCMRQDEVLYKIADRVKNFAVIYVCDLDQVPDFKQMYELYDPVTLMFFFRNKHMMCDFGTGNNNKLNWVLEDKQELIDIIETIYKGAKKGRGLVVSPKDYSTRYRY